MFAETPECPETHKHISLMTSRQRVTDMGGAPRSCNSPPSARGRGAVGLLKGVFIHPPVEEQPTTPAVRAKCWEFV